MEVISLRQAPAGFIKGFCLRGRRGTATRAPELLAALEEKGRETDERSSLSCLPSGF
jgi:hypothetical protein